MTGQTIQCVVMFADVAGSTAMYENLGDVEARGRISKALDSLISICKKHKGTLVKTIGDEIMCRFKNADDAFNAACKPVNEVSQRCTHFNFEIARRFYVSADREYFGTG